MPGDKVKAGIKTLDDAGSGVEEKSDEDKKKEKENAKKETYLQDFA
jgi:DNA replication protein DnaD